MAPTQSQTKCLGEVEDTKGIGSDEAVATGKHIAQNGTFPFDEATKLVSATESDEIIVLDEGICKIGVLHKGTGPELGSHCKAGGKVLLHFKALYTDGRVIDNSRASGWPPFELVLGKSFKLNAWELAVPTMRLGEVARIECSQLAASPYPQFSLVQRQRHAVPESNTPQSHDHAQPHSCVEKQALALELGDGLIEILNEDQLVFELEIVDYIAPHTYKEEFWEIDVEEKIRLIPLLREEGNTLVRNGQHAEALECYVRALRYLERVRAEPLGIPKSIDELETPLGLNACLCTLKTGRYDETVKYATKILKHDPENTKALLRRGRAHRLMSDVVQARADLEKSLRVNDDRLPEAQKELALVHKLDIELQQRERNTFKNLLL